MPASTPFPDVNPTIIECKRCPRLIRYCQGVAATKRKSYQNEEYWGKPVPSFGDPNPQFLIVGLAPAAHGANRTGRMFTGDRSGQWLYRALHRSGFANQSTFETISDGLTLDRTRITAAAHCAPPGNKPTPKELENCSTYLSQELRTFMGPSGKLKAVLILGKIALDQTWPLLIQESGDQTSKKPKFAHGAEIQINSQKEPLLIVMSYHPSQQNTFTKRLTEPMFDTVFSRVRSYMNRR